MGDTNNIEIRVELDTFLAGYRISSWFQMPDIRLQTRYLANIRYPSNNRLLILKMAGYPDKPDIRPKQIITPINSLFFVGFGGGP